MDAIQRLLQQVRRRQLLVCMYQPDEMGVEGSPTLAEISGCLGVASTDCMPVLHRLHARQLIDRVPSSDCEPLRLTPKGKRLVLRMSRDTMAVPQGSQA